MSNVAEFNRVMDATSFYRDGRPTSGVFTRNELLDPQSDRHFKYKKAVDVPRGESRLGADAVFELSDAPCVYFKYLADATPSDRDLTAIRELAWNDGLAPALWVVTPSKVLIYSCYSRPRTSDERDHEHHLIQTFDDIATNLESLNNFAGRLQFESGAFWREPEVAKRINRNQRVDKALLDDLADAEEELVSEGLPVAVAHALLGRSLFTAYLQDRGILKPQFFRAHFSVAEFTDVLGSKSKTDKLFKWLGKTFNGDVFPLMPSEARSVGPKHRGIVRRLLEGTSQSGQMRLWPYRFDVIPIELISSVYEMFTHSADGKTAKERGTHYTPINLVDLVLSQAFKGIPADGKILDMSCGSGVFLVESLRRLVGLRIAQGEKLDRALVRDTLHNQVFGVDISEEAIQIAAFSLYLALLELDPDPQPPSALRFRHLIGENLFAKDAFDEEAEFNRREPFISKGFAAVVGNPPWTRTKSISSNVGYCQRHGYLVSQQGKVDQAFLWRAGDFLSEDAKVALILHGQPFFSHKPEARTAKTSLMNRFAPELLIDLADLHQVKLFPTAVAPALVYIGTARVSLPEDSFTLVSARRSESFLKHAIVDICLESTARLPTVRAASDPDMLKVASWGSARDMALIEKLRTRPGFPKMGELLDKWSWPKGRGAEPNGSFVVDEKFPAKYLPSGEMPRYTFDATALPDRETNLTLRRGHSKPEIYRGPLLIALRGLRKQRFFSAVVNDDVMYTQLYLGFSATGENPEYRYILNGIMNSRLATYFLFMTASWWAVERSTVEMVDLCRLPVPDPEVVPTDLLAPVIEAERALVASEPTRRENGSLVENLNDAVLRLYGLCDDDDVLIRDALDITIDRRRCRGKSRALKCPTPDELTTYCQQLMHVIRPLLTARNERGIVAEILDVGPSALTVVNFSMVPADGRRRTIRTTKVPGLLDVLHRIEKKLGTRIIDRVYSQRVLRIYAGDDLYVIKPAELRYWSRSAALNDSDEILAEHWGVGRGVQ